jgi:malonyl-CoA decarboxylase
MVNYRYDLKTVETNHELFAHKGEVTMTRAIRAMLGPEAPKRTTGRIENA